MASLVVRDSMPISADKAGEDGFSLLEILIAMAIMSSLVMISILNISALKKRAEVVALEGRVRSLVELGRIEARVSANTVSLESFESKRKNEASIIENIEFSENAYISPLGACTAFTVTAELNDEIYLFNVEAITCHVSRYVL